LKLEEDLSLALEKTIGEASDAGKGTE